MAPTPEIPDGLTLAATHLAVPTRAVWSVVADVGRWAEVFPNWLASITADDDRYHAGGVLGQRYDMYPHTDEDALALDVEVVDELGSADVMRVRLIDARAGCFVVVTAARLAGISDADWQRQRDALATGIRNLPKLLS